MIAFATIELADQWASEVGANLCTVMVYREIPVISHPYEKQERPYGENMWRDAEGRFCYPQATFALPEEEN